MYVYYPPRTTNFFPPQVPYFGAALGDYAADLATYQKAQKAYQLDMLQWRRDKTVFDAASAAYAKKVANITAGYGADVSEYGRNKNQWDKDYAVYVLALDAWNAAFSNSKRSNTERALTIAKSYGLNLPQSFYDNGACLTQSAHDAYARQCTTVKGLGRGLGSLDSDCGMKALPVCQFGAKPTLRLPPTPPSKPSYPSKPTLRAMPIAPMAPTPPAGGSGGGSSTPNVPVSVSTPESALPEDTKQSGMLMNGLVIVAVAAGGYLIYRTLRKPKAQAA